MEGVGKFYAHLFYRLSQWAKSIADDGLHEWKALLAICVMECYLVLNIPFIAEVLLHRPILTGNQWIMALPLAIGLVGANYLALIHNGRWKRYESEFKSYSGRTNLIGSLIILGAMVVVLASLIVTFYAMSQLQWRQA